METNTKDNALKAWIEDEGRGAWAKLYKAIRAEIPSFALGQLTYYSKGQRLIPFHVACIISRETGIPLSKLSFKYVHKPLAS